MGITNRYSWADFVNKYHNQWVPRNECLYSAPLPGSNPQPKTKDLNLDIILDKLGKLNKEREGNMGKKTIRELYLEVVEYMAGLSETNTPPEVLSEILGDMDTEPESQKIVALTLQYILEARNG
jgi:hypothetical protein